MFRETCWTFITKTYYTRAAIFFVNVIYTNRFWKSNRYLRMCVCSRSSNWSFNRMKTTRFLSDLSTIVCCVAALTYRPHYEIQHTFIHYCAWVCFWHFETEWQFETMENKPDVLFTFSHKHISSDDVYHFKKTNARARSTLHRSEVGLPWTREFMSIQSNDKFDSIFSWIYLVFENFLTFGI